MLADLSGLAAGPGRQTLPIGKNQRQYVPRRHGFIAIF
jgi:hypothetical protein